ncbi:MAG TPA: SRPBCC family protein [Blastocatellia bacterium]|nr:SRPBCC family protein [Blastocatellia bacterium]
MNEPSVTHSNFVIERTYPATPQRVFAAFADPGRKRRWFADTGESQQDEFQMDFRVGGFERKRFRAKNGMNLKNDTVYMDIVPDKRIVFAYTMSVEDNRISSSQSTVELLPAENGTRLVFTEQAAFFEGADGPQMREGGWRHLLDNLGNLLQE